MYLKTLVLMCSIHVQAALNQEHHALLIVACHAQASSPRPWVRLGLALATLDLAVMMTVLPEDKRLQSQQSRNQVPIAGQLLVSFVYHAPLPVYICYLIWGVLP